MKGDSPEIERFKVAITLVRDALVNRKTMVPKKSIDSIGQLFLDRIALENPAENLSHALLVFGFMLQDEMHIKSALARAKASKDKLERKVAKEMAAAKKKGTIDE